MANFVFDKSRSTFEGHGQTWKVRSGIPGRYSPLPNGLYAVPKGSLMSGTPGLGVPHDPKYAQPPYRFTDKAGFSWFLWLGIGDLGVHPDGNVPGTMGCIGIADDDTKPLFYKLRQLNNETEITVLVK